MKILCAHILNVISHIFSLYETDNKGGRDALFVRCNLFPVNSGSTISRYNIGEPSSSNTRAAPKMSGELARKFARKALVPFHELHKGVDRSDPRASALFQLERNTRRGAVADSIHNTARPTHTPTFPTHTRETASHARLLRSSTRARIHADGFLNARIRKEDRLITENTLYRMKIGKKDAIFAAHRQQPRAR